MKPEENNLLQEGNDGGSGLALFWFLVSMSVGIGVMVGTVISMVTAIVKGDS